MSSSIKSFLMGLPLFNVIVIAIWAGLGSLELYLFPVTESSAPITVVGFFIMLLFMGGYAVCGMVFGIYKARKHDPDWKSMVLQVIFICLFLYGLYLLSYMLFSNDYSYVLRDVSAIVRQQIIGYVLGCAIGKLSRYMEARKYIS